MRSARNKSGVFWFAAIGLTMSLAACTQPLPFQARVDGSATPVNPSNSRPTLQSDHSAYPQSNALVVNYCESGRGYNGGFMTLPNDSKFTVSNMALTPPEGTPEGDTVTITMTCELDTVNNELLFTYGPHGSQFSPAAELKLSWKDLNIEIPKLYYVEEDGDYIEQQPDDIDVKGKWLIINVHHFSRYAVAWAR